jgi:hypothetical protein
MKKFTIAIVIMFTCTLAQASYIGDIADGMAARTWVKLPENASLQALGLPRAIFSWNNSAVWDPIRKQIRQIGAGGSCCSDGRFHMTTYDDATNTWSWRPTGFSGSGHAYDGNSINPETGYHYFGRFRDDNVRTWNGYVFGMLPPLPIYAATTPATAWFPEINNGQGGLCYFGQNGQRCWWDGTKWTTLSTMSGCGSYNNFAEYHPVHKVVWAGAGNGGDRVSYRIDAGLNATRLNNAPVSLNNHQSIQAYDPAGNNYIIFCQTDNSIWEFDIVSDKWAKITNATGPRPNATSTPYMFNVPISDYGVIMYVWHYYDRREVYLYKHTESSTNIRLAGALSGQPAINVYPNPFTAGTSISIGQAFRVPSFELSVFDINGKQLKTWNTKNKTRNRVSWNASNRAPGIYLLRAQIGNQVLSKQIHLVK